MTDDLDDLRAAMRAATPDADAATRAAHLALAQKNFEMLQESRDPTRPISDGSKTGLWTGVKTMLNTFTSRAALTATTAIVAVAFVALTPMRDVLIPTQGPQFERAPAVPSQERDRVADAMAPIAGEPRAEILFAEDEADVAPAASRLSKTLAAPAPSAAEGYAIAPVPQPDVALRPEADTEAFANADSNPLQITEESPVSTFSIDVDTVSYSVLRNSLMQGYLPTAEMVRIEELVNYFPYDYAAPDGNVPFQPTVSVSQTPWNPDTQLVHIGIQGALPDVADRPPLNLVFLIDTSGSMDQANKLPLLKQSFALMLGQLRDEDQVAIVTYAGSAGQVLEPTAASDRQTIMAALNRLDAGGSTAGQAGLQQAYATAAAMAAEGEVSRVILATDGDFNVGLSDPSALKDFIADKRDSGTYLSVLGFGRGNLDDATMQALAQNGNGQAAYIDTLAEAQKVLVDQLTGALFPIANDVKIQVEFNPATVAEYRLIGYETRALRREDFNNDKVDAGDIGAGHAVTALYEITPVGSPAQLSDPLRYGAAPEAGSGDELGFLRLRYKTPGSDTSNLIETAITTDLPAQADTGFAMAIAGFGQLLRGGTYLGNWGYDAAIDLATANKGVDAYGYRTEAIQLMRLAQSLSAQ
ncbi:vWA domain-containing protein [Sedimentitalea todarodis]|uniref:VWA domain-containing protein n=1 Tax=Sedimentitalea todarodis TaxID=1631240 RepID=A0ABU3VJD4_9RHOB|nr:VWA domain-containing protein [Sedimentitalea todarodis]MDU9006115.1 VWA domain-containing protein [Sedimentitalea todarodis]